MGKGYKVTDFFTSDTHFHHAKIIQFCNRPYATVEEMNEDIITKWNSVVGNKDRVFHLGDFSWGNFEKTKSVFDRLHGQKHLILGNHDDPRIHKKLGWNWIDKMEEVRIGDKLYQLCHYPQQSWDKSFHGARHVHGHCHGTVTPHGWRCDVGVDSWGFTPVSFEQLETLFAGLPRDGWGKPMPKGKIWNGRDFPYSFLEFFVGDGSADNNIPQTYTD